MKRKNRAGFTLVELMVVAIIVAILSAVTIPLMTGNKKRAMASEGEAALGTMRTALRAMYAETQRYNRTANESDLTAGMSATNIPGIAPGDLNGRYFGEGNYSIGAIGVNTYTLQVQGTGTLAGVTISLNEQGQFTRNGL